MCTYINIKMPIYGIPYYNSFDQNYCTCTFYVFYLTTSHSKYVLNVKGLNDGRGLTETRRPIYRFIIQLYVVPDGVKCIYLTIVHFAVCNFWF